MFACLYNIDLYMGIWALYVFVVVQVVKLIESPKALYKLP